MCGKVNFKYPSDTPVSHNVEVLYSSVSKVPSLSSIETSTLCIKNLPDYPIKSFAKVGHHGLYSADVISPFMSYYSLKSESTQIPKYLTDFTHFNGVPLR